MHQQQSPMTHEAEGEPGSRQKQKAPPGIPSGEAVA